MTPRMAPETKHCNVRDLDSNLDEMLISIQNQDAIHSRRPRQMNRLKRLSRNTSSREKIPVEEEELTGGVEILLNYSIVHVNEKFYNSLKAVMPQAKMTNQIVTLCLFTSR